MKATPPWEQRSGTRDQRPWSDLYALGPVAYRMVTGRCPPDSLERRLSADTLEPAAKTTEPGRYTEPYLRAIDTALRLEPTERHRSAQDWIDAWPPLSPLEGRGVARDDVATVQWYRKAAAQGFDDATATLRRLGK